MTCGSRALHFALCLPPLYDKKASYGCC